MRKIRAFSDGLRSGPWSENKFTNLTPYSPFHSQADKVVNDHWDQLQKEGETFYYEYQPVSGFIQPLDLLSIRNFISSIPEIFTYDLRGIFLCAGSRKQGNYSYNVYGCYHDTFKTICIFPFPSELCFYYKNKPKPSVCLEYERHGATWQQDKKGWKLEFTKESLRSFYLRDVVAHEIGHHVDNISMIKEKNYNGQERFAEWFALEFGMRNPNREISELGKLIQQIISQDSNEES